MAKMVDVTAQLMQASERRRAVEMPPALLSLDSGLSQRIGCSVRVKHLTVANNRHRLTLELSNGCAVHPRAQAILEHLSRGPVILSKKGRNLIVQQGHANFIDHCCGHAVSLLNGLARDYDEVELVMVGTIRPSQPLSD